MLRKTTLLALAASAFLFSFQGTGANVEGPATLDAPYVIVHEFDGNLVCHVRSGLPGCPAQLGQDIGETVAVSVLGVQGMLLEMDWTPALPLVGSDIGLNTIWNTVAGGDGGGAVKGAPVLRMYFEDAATTVDNNTTHETFCVEGCDEPERPRAPLPGVVQTGQISFNAFQPIGAPAANQPFTIYLSLFVGQTMPDGYSAIPEVSSDDPNIVIHQFDGLLVCHVRSGLPGCPDQLGQDTGETFVVGETNVTGMLLEMEWDAAFPVVNSDIGLNTLWNTVPGGDGSGAVNGASVLRLFFEDRTRLDGNQTVHETFCTEGCREPDRARAVLPGVLAPGQISYNAFQPLGAAPAVSQHFTIYLTLFLNEPAPECFSAVPGHDPCALAAPQNLRATPGLSVGLNWDAVEDADAYRVYRSTSGLGSGMNLLGTTTGLAFADPACRRGTVCTYVVAAVNEDGQGSLSNPAAAPGLA